MERGSRVVCPRPPGPLAARLPRPARPRERARASERKRERGPPLARPFLRCAPYTASQSVASFEPSGVRPTPSCSGGPCTGETEGSPVKAVARRSRRAPRDLRDALCLASKFTPADSSFVFSLSLSSLLFFFLLPTQSVGFLIFN